MIIQSGSFELTFVDDHDYTSGSSDNINHYHHEYSFTNGVQSSSRCGITCNSSNGDKYTCIILTNRGATRVNDNSAVIVKGRCYVAVGDMICCLSLPSLELHWSVSIDPATCFGLYYSEKHHCLFSHGELEIARLSLSGEVIWSTGGADIFSEGFAILDNYIRAIDFDNRIYRIDFETGREMK